MVLTVAAKKAGEVF